MMYALSITTTSTEQAQIMKAMILKQARTPLLFTECAKPEPKTHELLLKVVACGVCRTDLHIVNGELAYPALPLILGHQIIGIIEKIGSDVTRFKLGITLACLGWDRPVGLVNFV